jgi:L-alanine-DL-glutamate epimerase-like enolase superfamily enzyme
VFVEVPEIEDGHLMVPNAPGFGVTLDREVMKETFIAG